MADTVPVAKTTDLEPGTGTVVQVGRRQIALFNVDGTFHAIDNTCCHRGGPLGEGELDGTVVTCPWHGWQFDVTDGDCQNVDVESVDAYEVVIDGDDVRIRL